MASCLFPRVAEPVLLGSLGGQSLLRKELGSLIEGLVRWGGFRALPEVHLLTVKLLTLP